MKRLFRAAIAAALAVSFMPSGAVAAQEAVPVVGTAVEQRSFTGVWRGHVESADPRFEGDVEFRFDSDGVAIVRARTVPSRILWMRLTDHGIAGALEPYFDRERQSDVYTTFEATLDRGTLTGVLRERARMQWTEAARWSVRRVGN